MVLLNSITFHDFPGRVGTLYNTAMDRFSDFELGMGDVIQVEKDWRGVGQPQDAMHLQLPRFLVLLYMLGLGTLSHLSLDVLSDATGES